MFMRLPKRTQMTSAPIIQDVIIVGTPIAYYNPSGEMEKDPKDVDRIGGKIPPANETVTALIDRLFKDIKSHIKIAAELHYQSHWDIQQKQFKPSSANHITRLMFNECFFWTKEPFTVKQFEILQQKIARLVKRYPQNLHLILASFAVKTGRGKIMDVTPHIICGAQPQFSFIVKNYPFPGHDYKEQEKILPIVDIRNEPSDIDNILIHIDGKRIPVSFHNIVLCKTAGNVDFYTCIDICSDHAYELGGGVANNNLKKLIMERSPDTLASYCSHVLVSNTFEKNLRNSMGKVRQADHEYMANKPYVLLGNYHFGPQPAMHITKPRVCATLTSIPYLRPLLECSATIEKLKQYIKERDFVEPSHASDQYDAASNEYYAVSTLFFNKQTSHHKVKVEVLAAEQLISQIKNNKFDKNNLPIPAETGTLQEIVQNFIDNLAEIEEKNHHDMAVIFKDFDQKRHPYLGYFSQGGYPLNYFRDWQRNDYKQEVCKNLCL
jgi:hypothetical protein